MATDKAIVTVKGTRPLIMHNVRLASPLDPFTRKIKALTDKRTKTDDDRVAVARHEFEGSLYFDEVEGPYVPIANIFRSLIDGARITKAGKKVERGVALPGGASLGPGDPAVPLVYVGPRTVEGLWADPLFVDRRMVRIGQKRVERCRPIFREWGFEFEVYVDPSVLDYEEFVGIAANAGRMSGLGDYRMLYGRYETIVTPL